VKPWALLGDVHAHLDDFAEAQNCYDKALEINPKYAKVHQHLADVHYHEGNYRKAISSYMNLIKSDGKNLHHMGMGFLGIGKSYEKLHSLDSAIFAYQTVINCDSTIAEVYNRLGQAEGKRKGSMHASIQYYNKALRFDAKNAEAHRYLGEAYYKMGDQERAISHFNKSIELEPAKAELYLSLAEAYSKIGDAKSAQANLERAYALNPELKEEK
jgi:tetratricopeptide (TPR) repeat protein